MSDQGGVVVSTWLDGWQAFASKVWLLRLGCIVVRRDLGLFVGHQAAAVTIMIRDLLLFVGHQAAVVFMVCL